MIGNAQRQSAATASSGGSEAGRMFREQMENEGAGGRLVEVKDDPFERATPVIDSRAAARKRVNGRAWAQAANGGPVITGKVFDISASGICLILDDPFPMKKTANLECNIYFDGKHHSFTAQALSIYSVLTGGMGYKVGFQFSMLSPAATQAIHVLTS